jgi:hypothetical protein
MQKTAINNTDCRFKLKMLELLGLTCFQKRGDQFFETEGENHDQADEHQ